MSAQDVRGGGRLRSDLVSSGPPSSKVAGPPRTLSETGGEPFGGSVPPVSVIFCQHCFGRIGEVYRDDGTGWWCRTCAADNPIMCESCNERPAAIVEWDYYICSSCRQGGKR